ncbi:MAG: hypothetical protein SF339_22455 [Blastocatellia bacterium]|nr:hypothetical protein [Blastocatellia bacterium]
MTWPAWLHNQTLWLALLSGSVGGLWALSEIIGQFRTETGRALRTWGAWMLIAVNVIAAAVIYLLVIGLAPSAKTWPTALAIGLAWPTIFRNASLKLTQPIADGQGTDSAAIRLEQVYANIQKLALQLINGVLTRQRTRLLTEALRFDLWELERYARRMIALSPQAVDDSIIDRTLQRPVDDDAKKAYLAALVMDTFTRSALDDFIKEQQRRA